MASQRIEIFVVFMWAIITILGTVNGIRAVDKVPSGSLNTILDLKQEPNNPIVYPTRVKQISWKPRAFIYKGFLTDEECDHLISLVLLGFSVLVGSSPWVDLLGMVAGHAYYFLEDVYPIMTGRRLLRTPAIIKSMFSDEAVVVPPPANARVPAQGNHRD